MNTKVVMEYLMNMKMMVVDENDELLAQDNNTASSSRSSDSEMQAHREEIVHKMWEDYIKE